MIKLQLFNETLFKGKIFWLWGDTDRPSYPLGNFATSYATSRPPWNGWMDPLDDPDAERNDHGCWFLDIHMSIRLTIPHPGRGIRFSISTPVIMCE